METGAGAQRNEAQSNNVERLVLQSTFPPSLATLAKIEQKRRNRRGRMQPGTTSIFYDQMEREYDWLLPGWLVEERTVANGRLYKYYFDPDARKYYSKYEVTLAWELAGMILVDDRD